MPRWRVGVGFHGRSSSAKAFGQNHRPTTTGMCRWAAAFQPENHQRYIQFVYVVFRKYRRKYKWFKYTVYYLLYAIRTHPYVRRVFRRTTAVFYEQINQSDYKYDLITINFPKPTLNQTTELVFLVSEILNNKQDKQKQNKNSKLLFKI